MFAIQACQKVALEHDFLDAVEKLVWQGTKFSSMYVVLSFYQPEIAELHVPSPLYQVYN
jgi:hypothetical protein